MKTVIYEVTEKDIASFLGVTVRDIPDGVRALIKKSDFRYRKLDAHERDEAILTIVKRLESPHLGISGVGQKKRWIRGWNENLAQFIKSGYKENSLVPKYIQPKHPVRFYGEYVLPLNANFEKDFFHVIRRWLYMTYLSAHNPIYEFGCGSGANLVELAKLYPEKELHGLDWINVPKKIIDLLAEKRGYNIRGHVFDMFFPKKSFPLKPGAAILTINSLEQLGEKFEPFLQFVLSRKPALFVHVDSFVEFYHEDTLPDYLTLAHNRKRNYLSGYLTRLRALEREGTIELLKVQHVPYGGLYHDYYSFVVWRMKSVV